MQLAGHERHLLEKARERGYLDTGRKQRIQLELEFGRWCWKLRQPLVVITRQSVYSSYSTLKLDLCGTPNMLNAAGRMRIQELMLQSGGEEKDALNEVGGRWMHLEKSIAPGVAREAFKVATTLGYYQPDFELYEKREKEYSRKLGLREPDVLSKSAKV